MVSGLQEDNLHVLSIFPGLQEEAFRAFGAWSVLSARWSTVHGSRLAGACFTGVRSVRSMVLARQEHAFRAVGAWLTVARRTLYGR